MDFYQDKKAVSELSDIYLKLQEVSADTALDASKAADKKRGQLAAAGDKEGAAGKAAQAKRLYDAQAKKRLNKESTSNWRDDLREIVSTDDEAEKIVKEKSVKNKVVIDPELKLEQQLGGKVLKVDEVKEGMTTKALEGCPKCGKHHEGACEDVKEEVSDEYIETVQKQKQAEHEADLKRWQVEESILWDRIARDLTRLGEEYGCKFKVEGYQRNPEKGEEEERKRNKKVRGERTPMPPRGDKRREDFEKWYAANVR